MHTGFVVIAQDQQAEFRLAPCPPGRPSLTSLHQADGCTAAFMGRLHYRESLPRAQEISEAHLALDIYHREGAAGLERLEGDFALVLLDTRTGQLIALRDPMGGYPLFFASAGNRLVLS